jgi:hypothetical protein
MLMIAVPSDERGCQEIDNWLDWHMRRSRQLLRSYFRRRSFFNAIKDSPHAEEHPADEKDLMPSRDQQAVPRAPNLSDVLNDPIVMAVMRADGVSLDELARILGIPVCRAAFRSAHPRKGEET